VLDLVGVLLSMAVDTLHTSTFGSTVDTSLGSVDVVVDTVESTDEDHSGNALEGDDHVLLLVDFTTSDLVLVKVAHGPSEDTLLSTELSVEAFLALLDEFLVAELALLGDNGSLLGVLSASDTVVGVAKRSGLHVLIMLDDSVVADLGSLNALGSGPAEEKRTLESVVPADGVVALDDNGVEVGNEEEER
jgi:hypothetical protein